MNLGIEKRMFDNQAKMVNFKTIQMIATTKISIFENFDRLKPKTF
jgi:hypothetical protein